MLVDSDVGERQVQESYRVDPENIYVLPYIPSEWIYSNIEKELICRNKTRLLCSPINIFFIQPNFGNTRIIKV